MSRFDLDKLLAAAEANLDDDARARLTEALNAALDATEHEASLRASEATQRALVSLGEQLKVAEAQTTAQAEKCVHSITEASRKALGELETHSQRTEQNAASAARVAAFEANKARAV